MNSIIKSALYKLLKDWTFKITLIIGVALAVGMNLIYLGIDLISENIGTMCNGQSMFISSLTPTQNFGLTVPINLIVFTIGEFNCGTIRNKIIAGNKKTMIYLSLLITGAIFTVSLMAIYFGISVGIASIIGGFDINGPAAAVGYNFSPELLYQYPIMALFTYLFIVTFAVFVSTSIRNIGGAMPIVIVSIIALYFIPLISVISGYQDLFEGSATMTLGIQGWINPVAAFGAFSVIGPSALDNWFIPSIIAPTIWIVIFGALGIFVFNKQDVK